MTIVTAKKGVGTFFPTQSFGKEPKVTHFISEKQFSILKKAGIDFEAKTVAKKIEKNKSGVLADGKTPYMIIEENEKLIEKCFNKPSKEIIMLISQIIKKEKKEQEEKEQQEKQKEIEKRRVAIEDLKEDYK